MKMEKGSFNIKTFIEEKILKDFKENNSAKELKIGIDKSLINSGKYIYLIVWIEKYANLFSEIEKLEENYCTFVDDKINLINEIQKNTKFDYGFNKVKIHQINFCGVNPLEKYEKVFQFLENKFIQNEKKYAKFIKIIEEAKLNKKAISLLVTKLDDIACN